jgi:predicted molibdopterin-dependent oxidoreductase YjgC
MESKGTMPLSTLSINGSQINFATGQTILEVARNAGILVPTLCHYKDLTPTGACRVCLVEVEGARTLLPACATPAAPGMVVHTESPRVTAARQTVIELLLASGNHNCLICEANGACELQDLAYRYQIAAPTFGYPPGTHDYYENNNSMIVRDNSKCIMCGRCVRACNERQVNLAIEIGYRGAESTIVAQGDLPYIESECVFCGECVQACPTGALLDKQAINQGRPWELQQVRSTCPYCGVGCQIDLHVKDGRIVKVTGVDAVPNGGRLCIKGRFGWPFVHHADRLQTPLIKENGGFREATWNEALNLVATRLQEIKEKYGPETIGGWCSARVTNEENYLMQKFLRAVIGTNHVDHCARL